MINAQQQLRRELRQAGAKTSEINQLTSIAARLRQIKAAPTIKHSWRAAGLKQALVAASSVAIGVFIVMMSQSATPTSWLYPVQKLSDAVAIKVQPDYRGSVMMRRAQQVNQLVASRAPAPVILSSLNSYKAEAADYQAMPHTSCATFEYCKTNLEQAAAAAPVGIRQAIKDSIDSLSST